MVPLSPIESRALKVIRRWQHEYRNSPSVSELGRALERSSRSALHVARRLEKKGYIWLAQVDRRVILVPLYWE